ncbi:MAG: putative heme d1 biosynthesis radical SAM protein NirJ1 [Fibrobacter sp.]|nr:putative heme d1 biosynthesis radical SAM protein NirJ1 [Fibrobacter sp.]
MISITKLLMDAPNYGDQLRYTPKAHEAKNGVSEGRGPVVVWNCTKTCNLKCVHCYARSEAIKYQNELTHEEGLALIDQLAEFNVPVILFSGGEPLLRPDFFELANYAASKGIRPTISTNGTCITPEVAEKLKAMGVGYVGISLDGNEETHDKFRGKEGAYKLAIRGIRNCVATGQKVGLRFTITKDNYRDLNSIFDLIESENIDRACFYHLVYSGRGSGIVDHDLSHEESRQVMDLIIDRVLDFKKRGLNKEILTVDNHADAVYLYQRMKREDPERAKKILELIQSNGGNRSGMAFGNIDSIGNVHPDQFTQYITLGNVRERKFGDIWTDVSNPIMAGLKDRKPLLKGRCPKCAFLNLCNGNFRTRAEAVTGDFWEMDPACYLTDDEVVI